jgi:hypothetical protein
MLKRQRFRNASISAIPAFPQRWGFRNASVSETPAFSEGGMRLVEASTRKTSVNGGLEPTGDLLPGEVPSRQKITVHLEFDLAERLKNAAYWNRRLTVSGLANEALRAAMDLIEAENGGPYPPREEELRGGRPLGTRTHKDPLLTSPRPGLRPVG